MSNQINNGGPAFPSKLPKNADQHLLDIISSGMSLRDYFAGQALTALRTEGYGTWEDLALDAYDIADDMLEARNQEQPQ